MLRRIATSIFYTIILFIVGCIGYKLGGSSNWMQLAMINAIGGFMGFFMGYRQGEKDVFN